MKNENYLQISQVYSALGLGKLKNLLMITS